MPVVIKAGVIPFNVRRVNSPISCCLSSNTVCKLDVLAIVKSPSLIIACLLSKASFTSIISPVKYLSMVSVVALISPSTAGVYENLVV